MTGLLRGPRGDGPDAGGQTGQGGRGQDRAFLEFEPPGPAEGQYPIEFCRARGIVLLSNGADGPLVGSLDAEDEGLGRVLSLVHGQMPRFIVLGRLELQALIARAHGQAGLRGEEGDAAWEGGLDPAGGQGPVIDYVNSLILEALRRSASDIHVESGQDSARVRLRRDGILEDYDVFPLSRFWAVSTRLKVMAGLNVVERRLPQDGRLELSLAGAKAELRASFVPLRRGESIVLRILSGDRQARRLNELGLGDDDLASVKSLLGHPHGLILACGPTGCGKTTSLSAMLRELSDSSLKIVSVEDPVEYRVPGVCHIQVNEEIGLGFSTLLRRVLRQDPDVIMVGEIRDRETAELAVRAALSGHLVLASLHCGESEAAAARLCDLGVEAYLVAAVLRSVMSQRLVRRLCPACGGLGQNQSRDAPCPQCHGQGASGRLAVFDCLSVDESMARLILEGAPPSALRGARSPLGHVGLAAKGLELVERGLCSLAELKKEIEI